MGPNLTRQQKKNSLIEHSYSKGVIYSIIFFNGLFLALSSFLSPDPRIIFNPLILKIITLLFYFSIPIIMILKEDFNEKLAFHSLMSASLVILSLIKIETLHLPSIFFLLTLSFIFLDQKKGLFYCFFAVVAFILKQSMLIKDLLLVFLFFTPLFFIYYLSLKKLNKLNNLLFFHERSFLSFLENFEIPNIINYCIFQTGDQKLFWGEKGQNIKVLNYKESNKLNALLNHFSVDDQKKLSSNIKSRKKNASRWSEPCTLKDEKGRHFSVKCHGFHFWLRKKISIEVLIFQDISTFQDTRIENEISFLSQFFEKIPVPFFIKNNNGRYRFVNDTFSKNFNIAKSKIMGKRDTEVFTKTLSKNLNNKDSEVFNYGRSISYKDDFFSSQSDLKKFLAIKFPIKDLKKGKINGLLGVLVDISDDLNEREDLEKDIVILNAATKLASLAEMSSGVAHEINNPLTIIAGIAQIMDMKLENNNVNLQELHELTKTVQKATERASNVVRSLEEFSRDGSQDPISNESLKNICNESLSIFREKCNKFKIEIKTDELQNTYIPCRSIQLVQVLFHLLNNSIFEVLKLEEKWIEFSTKEEEEFVTLRLSDSGKGIKPTIVKKMFDPFFSKKEGVSTGTGLGLSISKLILHEHGGDINYETYKGHTSFVLKFPKKRD